MSRKAKTETAENHQKASADAEAATAPETPATGNGGEAEAGVVAAVTAPAEARTAPPPDIGGAEGWEVVVTGPARGRWRAGRHFGPEPVVIPAAELTEDEARALSDDPQLTFVPRRIA